MTPVIVGGWDGQDHCLVERDSLMLGALNYKVPYLHIVKRYTRSMLIREAHLLIWSQVDCQMPINVLLVSFGP